MTMEYRKYAKMRYSALIIRDDSMLPLFPDILDEEEEAIPEEVGEPFTPTTTPPS